MAVLVSMKAALPLTKIPATASYDSSNTGPWCLFGQWPHSLYVLMFGPTSVLCPAVWDTSLYWILHYPMGSLALWTATGIGWWWLAIQAVWVMRQESRWQPGQSRGGNINGHLPHHDLSLWFENNVLNSESVSYAYISGLTICFSFILGSCAAVSLFSFKPFMIDTHISHTTYSHQNQCWQLPVTLSHLLPMTKNQCYKSPVHVPDPYLVIILPTDAVANMVIPTFAVKCGGLI